MRRGLCTFIGIMLRWNTTQLRRKNKNGEKVWTGVLLRANSKENVAQTTKFLSFIALRTLYNKILIFSLHSSVTTAVLDCKYIHQFHANYPSN